MPAGDGHGTHVASIAVGRNVGVAKEANVVAVRVLDCEVRRGGPPQQGSVLLCLFHTLTFDLVAPLSYLMLSPASMRQTHGNILCVTVSM